MSDLDRRLSSAAKSVRRLRAQRPVRSYVLEPVARVRDERTGFETSDATAVLNGKIDDFLRAALTA